MGIQKGKRTVKQRFLCCFSKSVWWVFKKNDFLYLFIPGCLGLCCCEGFSPVVVSSGALCLWYSGSLWWLLLFQSRGSRVHGLRTCTHWALEHWLSCGASSEARGTFLDQGSNPSFLQWQAASLPLSHQENRFDDLWRSHKEPSEGWTEPTWVVWCDVRVDKKFHKEYCGIKTASELRKESMSPKKGYQIKLDFLISFLKL